MNIVGQEHIVNQLNRRLNESRFFIIISGARNTGKSYIATTVCYNKERFYFILEGDNITAEEVRELSTIENIVFIIRKADLLKKRIQNILLKTLEEGNISIIMLVEDTDSLLNTVTSRAEVIPVIPYTQDELLQFTDNERLIYIFRSPSQLLKYKEDGEEMIKHADKILKNIGKISHANIFRASNLVEESNWDVGFFISVMRVRLYELYGMNRPQHTLILMGVLNRASYDLRIPNIDSIDVLQLALLQLKEVAYDNSITL